MIKKYDAILAAAIAKRENELEKLKDSVTKAREDQAQALLDMDFFAANGDIKGYEKASTRLKSAVAVIEASENVLERSKKAPALNDEEYGKIAFPLFESYNDLVKELISFTAEHVKTIENKLNEERSKLDDMKDILGRAGVAHGQRGIISVYDFGLIALLDIFLNEFHELADWEPYPDSRQRMIAELDGMVDPNWLMR